MVKIKFTNTNFMQKIQVKEYAHAKNMNLDIWYKDKDDNSYHRGKDGIIYSGSPNDRDSEELNDIELEVVENF